MSSVSVKQRRQDLWVRLVLQVFVESDRQVELMPAEASVVKIDNVQTVLAQHEIVHVEIGVNHAVGFSWLTVPIESVCDHLTCLPQ